MQMTLLAFLGLLCKDQGPAAKTAIAIHYHLVSDSIPSPHTVYQSLKRLQAKDLIQEAPQYGRDFYVPTPSGWELLRYLAPVNGQLFKDEFYLPVPINRARSILTSLLSSKRMMSRKKLISICETRKFRQVVCVFKKEPAKRLKNQVPALPSVDFSDAVRLFEDQGQRVFASFYNLLRNIFSQGRVIDYSDFIDRFLMSGTSVTSRQDAVEGCAGTEDASAVQE